MTAASTPTPAPLDPGGLADVVVVGGGPAGLTAATNLARVRRTVVVVDAGEPRNAPAAHMHGYLSRDGMPPAELLRIGRDEVRAYGVPIVDARAIRVTGDLASGFTVDLDDGTSVRGRRLLVATGLVDELPDVPGLRERWGIDVVHCPFCHGWEIRDRALVVVGSGGLGGHAAQVFHTLSDDITLVVHDGHHPDRAEASALAALGITVASGPVAEVVVEDDAVTGVRLADGTVLPAGAVVARGPMVARAEFLQSLGVPTITTPMGVHVDAGPTGATSAPGVWVAGNVDDLAANVVMACAAGARVGSAVHADLLAADIDRGRRRSGHEHPDPGDHEHPLEQQEDDGHARPPDLDKEFWDGWYAEHEQIWSGDPNPSLVAEAGELTPGRALDIGAGEGGDALWLAAAGWAVTAVDIAETAVERGRAAAEATGHDVADRITWLAADITRWAPPTEAFDLVAVHYVHLTAEERPVGYAACADAVAPGGTLLIVGHHPDDMGDLAHRWGDDRYFTAEQVAAELDDRWEQVTAEARPRPHRGPDGEVHTIRDTVLVARRRPR